MIQFPDIRPYIFKFGRFEVRWYGLMYIIGLAFSFFLFRRQAKERGLGLKTEDIEDLYFWMFLLLLIGARLGYAAFYNFGHYIRNPLDVFAVWKGGMSFHGGLIGVTIGIYLYSRMRGLDSWMLADMVTATAPVGLFFGRMGNFINGELYGRPSDVPWAMVFPLGGDMPRHPSQLYEAFAEGILLFIIVWGLRNRMKHSGQILGLGIMLYGIVRFIIEFFREPDSHIGFVLWQFSMGQALCAVMILAGAAVFLWRGNKL